MSVIIFSYIWLKFGVWCLNYKNNSRLKTGLSWCFRTGMGSSSSGTSHPVHIIHFMSLELVRLKLFCVNCLQLHSYEALLYGMWSCDGLFDRFKEVATGADCTCTPKKCIDMLLYFITMSDECRYIIGAHNDHALPGVNFVPTILCEHLTLSGEFLHSAPTLLSYCTFMPSAYI